VIKWLADIKGFVQPENWHPATLKIQGIFNKVLTEFNKDREDNFDSYHYKTGVKKVTEFLTDKIMVIDSWKVWYQDGLKQMATEFCEDVYVSKSAVDKPYSPKYAAIFDDLVSALSFEQVKATFNKIQSPELANQFLSMMIDSALVDDEKLTAELFTAKLFMATRQLEDSAIKSYFEAIFGVVNNDEMKHHGILDINFDYTAYNSKISGGPGSNMEDV